ncbi:class I SAM-dependent methyltransferase [Dyadobacter sp. 32]|uniref:class I SAM-dependent methyltransferase n=1 Tax=Dyadobacter sp. 32 TaxID=538966 RepID=UPI0011EF694E
MIDNRLEYQRMYEVEQKLWWYKTLHGKVLKNIQKHFPKDTAKTRILDAACGTGGLLSFLRERGFTHLTGFDYSRHAVDFSLERDLDVNFGDLRQVGEFRPGEKFDVISCNDALYFLTDEEIISALREFRMRLHEGGLIVINIHAFEAFSGTHDLAVGSSRRFELEQFRRYAQSAGLSVQFTTYWPFVLSLPILAVRKWQQFQIRKNKITTAEADSDVSYPGNLINGILQRLMALEEAVIPSAPFGSSLFLILQPSFETRLP